MGPVLAGEPAGTEEEEKNGPSRAEKERQPADLASGSAPVPDPPPLVSPCQRVGPESFPHATDEHSRPVQYHRHVARREPFQVSAVVAAMENGAELEEGTAFRLLRSPHCTTRAVELLLLQPVMRRSRALVALVVRHPACPRAFALDAMPHLGWRDLLAVATDHRSPPPVRRQAERKLAEKLGHLALGERVALARQATRGLLPALMRDADARCIGALLENPRFTEDDAVRLVATNSETAAVLAVLRHPRWGGLLRVVQAAMRSAAVPLGVALGIAATLSETELRRLLADEDVGASLREGVARLVAGRERRRETSN